MRRWSCRRLIALGAAYAVAFSALLPPLAVAVAVPAAAFFDLCATTAGSKSDAGGDLPLQHMPACPLAGACCAPGCAACPPIGDGRHAAARLPFPLAIVSYEPRPGEVANVRPDVGPQRARGPPAA